GSLRQAASSKIASCACSTTRRYRTALPSSCRRRGSSPTRATSSCGRRRPASFGPTIARLPSSFRISTGSLVALVFPNFRDGRAYSQARLLRERHQFRGELRATGQVLRDQLLFMQRAGFDAFEVTKDADAAAFAAAVQRYSVFQQPTGDGRASTLTARRARGTSPAVRNPREYAI